MVFRQRLIAGVFVVAALIAGIALDQTAPFGLPDRRDPAALPPVVRFLKERGGYDRIMGDRRVIAPNYASVFGLYDVRYVEALAVDWFHRFVVEGLETSERRWWHALWFTGAPERAVTDGGLVRVYPGSLEDDMRLRLRGYSLLGVRYLLVPRGTDLNSRARNEGEWFPIVYRNEVVVHENPSALPRAFVVGQWENASSAAEARARALSGAFDLRSHAVVEAPQLRPGGGRGRAAIVAYTANRVVLDVDTNGPALVVLTDTFYPGWRAWLDDAPAEIYRVDGVARGVFVDGGRHRIVMRFFPPSQAIGMALGGGALAVGLALALSGPRRSRSVMAGAGVEEQEAEGNQQQRRRAEPQ